MDKKCECIDVKVKEELLKNTLPSNAKSVFRKKNLKFICGCQVVYFCRVFLESLGAPSLSSFKNFRFFMEIATTLICSNEVEFEREFMQEDLKVCGNSVNNYWFSKWVLYECEIQDFKTINTAAFKTDCIHM